MLVTLDTLRADRVEAYGGTGSATPHLDRLAREGLVHELAYTSMPTTGPAHVSIFTGLAPSRHGALRNGVPMEAEHRPRELAERLRAAGYATAAFVSSAVLQQKAVGLHGFEVYDAPPGFLRPGQAAVRSALAWLDAHPREPVFLWVHLYDPHAPYGPALEKGKRLPLRPGDYGWVDSRRYADPAARRAMRDAYDAGVRDADAALGALVDGARARLSSPPLVVAVADHGEALDEHLADRGYAFDHGEFLDLEQVRIPLVIAGPGVASGRSPAPVSIRDLYTTLLEAAGVGDPAAGAESRRDLRVAASGARRVGVERQRFEDLDAVAPSPEAAAAVRAHAVAVVDGRSLAIAGEDGAVEASGGAPDPDAVAAALAALRAAAARGPGAAPIDAETADALRSLGYAE